MRAATASAPLHRRSEPGSAIRRAAMFSPCRRWRYRLVRTWDAGRPVMNVIGLNPSTADESRDDPTIRRCIRFARDWGFGGLVVTNLFAYRATFPANLRRAPDPVGPANDRHLLRASKGAGLVLAAWGAHGRYLSRDREVLELLDGAEVWCLGRTRDGSPLHPLRQPARLRPARYSR